MPKEVRIVPKKKAGPGWWTEGEKMEAVAAFLMLGNLRMVAATTRIPEDTLRKWKGSPWWIEAEAELRRGSKINLSARLKTALDKALPALEDRIENGEYFYNPALRKMDRRPMAARDLIKATATILDRQLIVEKQSQEEKQTDEGVLDRLTMLAAELVKFSKAKTIEGSPSLVDPIDVVPSEVKEIIDVPSAQNVPPQSA